MTHHEIILPMRNCLFLWTKKISHVLKGFCIFRGLGAPKSQVERFQNLPGPGFWDFLEKTRYRVCFSGLFLKFMCFLFCLCFVLAVSSYASWCFAVFFVCFVCVRVLFLPVSSFAFFRFRKGSWGSRLLGSLDLSAKHVSRVLDDQYFLSSGRNRHALSTFPLKQDLIRHCSLHVVNHACIIIPSYQVCVFWECTWVACKTNAWDLWTYRLEGNTFSQAMTSL